MLNEETLIVRIGRNRSGQDSGEIDMEVAISRIENLSDYDFEQLLKIIDAAKDACVYARKRNVTSRQLYCEKEE